jgi:epoxyqueuosine reductase
MTLQLSEPVFGLLSERARALGIPRLGVVALDHPGFEPARRSLRAFAAAGKAGTMGYLAENVETRAHPENMHQGAKSIIMGLLPYRGTSGPIARYAQSADYHTILHRRFNELDRVLQGYLPGVENLVCVDTRPVLERSAAMLAGLGFIGKHGCLIAPGLGSFVLLGGMLTTATWTGPKVDQKLDVPPWDACGSCTLCLESCPTDAFDGPGQLDPQRCVAYLTLEFRESLPTSLAAKMGERIAGCDRCQEVCPYNASPTRESRVEPHVWLGPAGPSIRPLSMAEILDAGSSPYRAFTRGSPLNRVSRRAMKRNVLWALRNRRSRLSDSEIVAVSRLAAGDDENLAELAHQTLEHHGLIPAKQTDQSRE